jgi:hypothetical protein
MVPFRILRKATCVAIAFTVVSTSVAAAQTRQSPQAASTSAQPALGSAAFERLIARKPVIVLMLDGRELEGVFTIAPTALAGTGRMAGVMVPYDQIVRVERVSHHLRKWTFIGLAAGAGVGAALISRDRGNLSFMLPPIGGGIGAGLGALVGGVVNAHYRETDVVYDKQRTMTASVVPILSSTRKGIAVSLTWR